MRINIFWFRRDLRLEDNTGLSEALKKNLPVLLLFIFDEDIICDLPQNDSRITFIYQTLKEINSRLKKHGSSLLILKGKPVDIWKKLIMAYEINSVFANCDYEPYSIARDNSVEKLLNSSRISFFSFKDQVLFEKNEILKPDNKPYTVFTPYSKQWLKRLRENNIIISSFNPDRLYKSAFNFPSLEEIGFSQGPFKVKPFNISVIDEYNKYRDIPSADLTSYLSPHLRFGTVSVREIIKIAATANHFFLNELVWREFFMQILYHFPRVITENFKPAYNFIPWLNSETDFKKWCNGETGFPMVDAGMRQLNTTGYMHNRVRMITAGFLCKHLLIDWRWGEAYFAEKLLDYELSSNNGNWQWAAGTGCDAVPYFRVFNPDLQQKKFDPDFEYARRWIPDLEKSSYAAKIVDHEMARLRAINTYKISIRH